MTAAADGRRSRHAVLIGGERGRGGGRGRWAGLSGPKGEGEGREPDASRANHSIYTALAPCDKAECLCCGRRREQGVQWPGVKEQAPSAFSVEVVRQTAAKRVKGDTC